MLNLNLLMTLLGGGIPGAIVTVVNLLTKGRVNLTAEGIDSGAERMATASQADVEKACAMLKIVNPADVSHAVGLQRIAGKAEGDFFAFLAEKAAHIQHAA